MASAQVVETSVNNKSFSGLQSPRWSFAIKAFFIFFDIHIDVYFYKRHHLIPWSLLRSQYIYLLFCNFNHPLSINLLVWEWKECQESRSLMTLTWNIWGSIIIIGGWWLILLCIVSSCLNPHCSIYQIFLILKVVVFTIKKIWVLKVEYL